MNPLTPITDDIYQVRLPLPFALNSVNCYLLRGDPGWTVLDAGLNYPPAQAAWRAAFEALQLELGQIQQIILTHAHPDHYGLAGWLQQQSGAPVRLSAPELRFAEQIWQERNLPPRYVDLFEWGGMPEELRQAIRSSTAKLAEATRPHPDPIEALIPGESLVVGQRQFEIIQAPGHADGQVIFYDAGDRLLLVGDHVLSQITPHIGRWTLGQPAPLARYLASLQELAQRPVRLALPGHGELITAWTERLADLEAHHAQRLDTMAAAVSSDGNTAYQVCRRVFDEEYNVHELRFAMAETQAHLEHLVDEGRIVQMEREGMWWYLPA